VSNPTPELARALEGLQSTGRTIDGLTDDPQRAADFVATVLSENGGELADPLSTIEDGLYRFDTGLRRQLFEKQILGAWGGLVATTQTHLNRRWREDVSRPFDTRLQRLYPFDAGAAMDASLVDVETFFAPETGTLDAFLQAELRPFYDADRGRAKTWRGTGVSFSAETTRLFAQADRLQSALFEGGVIHVAFEMRPDQPEREGDAPFVSRVRINVHGTTDTYTMGQPYWFEATWPGRPDASLSVDGRGTALPEKRYTGDWGLLRLLQDARIRSVTRTQSSVRWRFEEPGRFTITVPYDIRARRGMELFTDPSGFFRLSVPTTLN
jgi:type VI protein secretion system component VasK